MQFSRSRRKSGPAAVLSGFRRALVLGGLIFIALKANAPKRLMELYQSLSSASPETAAQHAGGGDATAGTPSAAAEDNASETENVAASSATGEVGLPGDSATSDQSGRRDNDPATDDAPLTHEIDGTSTVEAGDAGSLDAQDVRTAESGVIGFGDDSAAADVSAVSTEAGDAAGYEEPDTGRDATAGESAGADLMRASTESTDASSDDAPDAQGLILMNGPDISDRKSSDAGGAPSAADAGVDMAGSAASAQASGSASGSSSTPRGEGTEDTPGMVTEDEDAVPGDGTTECPAGFPIKGNGRSRLYHMPEGFAYPRTKPEVCFRTPEAAEKAGFRRAKG